MNAPTPFNAKEGLAVVPVRICGPTGTADVRLALDTGATMSLIRSAVLASIGCDPSADAERVEVTTGSSVLYVPRVNLASIRALGREQRAFPVICHTLPPSAAVDGVLGLDFLRGHRLVVDFRAGTITLK